MRTILRRTHKRFQKNTMFVIIIVKEHDAHGVQSVGRIRLYSAKRCGMPRTATKKKVLEELEPVDYIAELVNDRERDLPSVAGGPLDKDVMHDHYDIWFYS